MSTSGGPPTAEKLRKLAKLVARNRPWYEALGMTADRASDILGEDANDYVSEQGSGLGRKTAELLLSAADVDALNPVCVVFKALFDAVKGAAKNRADLIRLIDYGVQIVQCIETSSTRGLSCEVKKALKAFGEEVESVVHLAGSFGVTQQPGVTQHPNDRRFFRRLLRRAQEVVNHREISEIIQDHVKQFERILFILTASAALQSATASRALLDEIPNQRKAALRTHWLIVAVLVAVCFGFGSAVAWLARTLQRTSPKLADVPSNVPMGLSWHVARLQKVDRVCNILGGEKPAVAALTGWSGAGKTTAAAAMVGERHGPIRPRVGETEDQARTRLDCLRALFPDGVVWLRVGRGEGSADRLPSLMLRLAERFHEDVMEEGVDAPAVGEDGDGYVKKIVSQESLRCLVVADDVWEVSVVEKVRNTGLWVLLTTRFPEMVEPNERVVMDKLTETEAEDVLRGAAELPPGESLCDAAKEVLKICGRVAMDIAFVGSWSSVRAANGVQKSSKAWARTVEEIKAQMDDVRRAAQAGNAGKMRDSDINRLAVLRAGFKYLGREDTLAQELYVALAVFPDGHAFADSDAAVLLGDEEAAEGPILILERWGVLRRDALEKYRMHDAHVDFAREKLMGWEVVREPAVGRWTIHISRLNFAIGIDVYALLRIWRALERVGGEGWWASRPYDDQLLQIAASNRSKILAVDVVAGLYEHDQRFSELETIMQRALENCDDHGGNGVDVQIAALFHIRQSLLAQGRFQESDGVVHRLCKVIDLSSMVPTRSSSVAQPTTTFHAHGICAVVAGLHAEGEEWFRKALRSQEHVGRTDSSQTVGILHDLGRCVRLAGRPKEAQDILKRALDIKEAKLGPGDLKVAWTLSEMGRCVLQAGRPEEAEAWFKRVLKIKEAKMGRDHVQVVLTLHDLGACAWQAGRLEEAMDIKEQAEKIQNLGKWHWSIHVDEPDYSLVEPCSITVIGGVEPASASVFPDRGQRIGQPHPNRTA